MTLVSWLSVTVASVVATCVIRFGAVRYAHPLSCPWSCAPAPALPAAGRQVQAGASSQV